VFVQVPVLVVPSTLHFPDGYSPHSAQLLTLYNPYSHNFSFKVLSTQPSLYSVQPSAGALPRSSQVQILVRHKPIAANAPVTARPSNRDKFLVELYEETTGGRTGPLRGKTVIGVDCSPSGGGGGAAAASASALPQPIPSSAASRYDKHGHAQHASAVSHIAGYPAAAAAALPPRWSSVTLPLRLLPLLLGTILVALIASGELMLTRHGLSRRISSGGGGDSGGSGGGDAIATALVESADDPSKLWLCFCIGLITMLLQLKFLEL